MPAILYTMTKAKMNVIQHFPAGMSVIIHDVQKVFLAFSAYIAYTGSVKGTKVPNELNRRKENEQ